jgi:hypothetical protein
VNFCDVNWTWIVADSKFVRGDGIGGWVEVVEVRVQEELGNLFLNGLWVVEEY